MAVRLDKDPKLGKVLAELARLSDEASRDEFFARNRWLLSTQSVEGLAEAVREYVRVDVKKALAFAEAAVAIASRVGDKDARARALRAKANALWFVGQNQSAANFHAQSIKLFEEAGNLAEVGRTLSGSIQPLILLGEYDSALQAANRAREIFTSLGDAVRLARLEINVGNIYHRQDGFAEALACYERAHEQLLPDKDAEGMAAALHNIVVCLIALNDFEKAIAVYERARAFCEQHNMPLAVAQADYNIAYLYYFRGEYTRAIQMLSATRETFQKTGDPYHSALCQLDLCEIYLDLNLSDEAAEMAREAFERFQELGTGYEAAKALSNLAIALGQQGKASRALELFAEAREMFLKEKNRVWPSLVDLYRALVYYHEGQLSEARRFCLRALDFFRSSGLPGKAILCHLLLGRLCLRSGDLPAARQECANALGQLEPIEAPTLFYQAQLLMGEIEAAARNSDEAYRYYQAAREALETLRSGLHHEELKIAFMKNRLEVYENLVGLCVTRDSSRASAEEAWSYMEQAKSRSLRDLITRHAHPLPPTDSAKSELLHRIRYLREQLHWYYHRIELEQLGQEHPSEKRLEKLQALAQDCERELLRLLQELPSSAVEWVGLDTAHPVKLQVVREALDQDTTLLEYFLVRGRIFAALITRQDIEIVPLAPVSHVRNLLHLLQFQLSKFRLDPRHVKPFEESLFRATQAHLRELYEEVIAPARRLLRGRHLVVVPHDVLHYVPFHALFDGERYLIDAFAISYAPSASIYADCQCKKANPSGASLILGVSDPQTPFIREEVQAVAAMLPGAELFLDSSANRRVLEEKGPQSRFIHVATHGFFRPANPMFSGIRLGDSYLNVHDLYNLRLPAELVTLSGCATGLSIVAAGDELLGLVRGLLYAGAQSLLLTLWDVQDRSTAEFMTSFYRHFQHCPNRAAALQAATRELRARYPHPYYWAPFVLLGKVSG